MRVLITGICGFVGNTIAEALQEYSADVAIFGIDNLSRAGSEVNRSGLRQRSIQFIHGDLRVAGDLESLPPADWVIDAAAIPSVTAGVGSGDGSRRLMDHNVAGTINVLEYCKRHRAGLVLISTNRVYSIPMLASIPLVQDESAFRLDAAKPLPAGLSAHGIDRTFSTAAPVSLYGSTKLAAELLALEYGAAFDFPVWIDRCGVLAGAGQFGTPDQGIFAYWLNAHRLRRPMRYIGFGGSGRQVRDALHPRDLAALIVAQMRCGRAGGQRLYTAGGGPSNAMSLAQLTRWCNDRFGSHEPVPDPRPRVYDTPWMAMDNREACRDFEWAPETTLANILDEIATHSERNPEWLDLSAS